MEKNEISPADFLRQLSYDNDDLTERFLIFYDWVAIDSDSSDDEYDDTASQLSQATTSSQAIQATTITTAETEDQDDIELMNIGGEVDVIESDVSDSNVIVLPDSIQNDNENTEDMSFEQMSFVEGVGGIVHSYDSKSSIANPQPGPSKVQSTNWNPPTIKIRPLNIVPLSVRKAAEAKHKEKEEEEKKRKAAEEK